ncbi:MAG TPA: TIGR02391 family protein [Solirubrobacterales bacterium]|nr:TIGR02391 family protein [Solirubrobacterales bacterium]
MTWPTDVDDFLALDAQQQRGLVLAGLAICPEGERGENFILHRQGEWFADLAGFGPLPADVPARQEKRHAAEAALREAYSGLMSEGLIRPDPRSGRTFCQVTAAGQAALAEAALPDGGRVTFARKALSGIDLHPALRKRQVDSHFTQGKYETALRDGSVFLEDSIRNLCGLPANLVGVKLASKAFSTSGKLIDPGQTPGEQAGLQALYQGFFGFIRNQVAHQDFRYDSNKEAFQALMLLDYLVERLAEAADRLSMQLG